jgi:hypothetical protein
MNIINWLKAKFLTRKQLHDPTNPANMVVTVVATHIEDIANTAVTTGVTKIVEQVVEKL